jgi:hypothetical protein
MSNPNLGVEQWYIDPQNGDDSAGGTLPTSALKTPQGLIERWGTERPRLTANVKVTFLTDQLDETNPFYPDVVLARDNSFTVEGTLIDAGQAGTLSVATPQAGNTAWEVSDSALGPAGWTPFIDMILVDTTTGAYGWIATDLGSKVARVTQPYSALAGVGEGGQPQPADLATMSAGDSYKVVRPTKVNLLGMAVDGPVQNNFGYGVVQNLWAMPSTVKGAGLVPGEISTLVARGSTNIYASQCRFSGFMEGQSDPGRSVLLINCAVSSGGNFPSGRIFGGLVRDPGSFGVRMAESSWLDGGVLLLGAFASIGRGAGAIFGNVGVFSPSQAAIKLARGSRCVVADQGFGAKIWGDHDGQDTIHVAAGGALLYVGTAANTFPIGGSFQLNGQTSARGFDNALGLPSSSQPTLISNLDVPTPAGFGGSAQDFASQAAVLLYVAP